MWIKGKNAISNFSNRWKIRTKRLKLNIFGKFFNVDYVKWDNFESEDVRVVAITSWREKIYIDTGKNKLKIHN
jgi:hypothetical protein